MKRNVALVQVNHAYGKNVFLPYSVGLLAAYAKNDPIVNDNFSFNNFVYLREPVEQILERLTCPEIFGISAYIWNFEFSMALGKAARFKFPNCLIVLGGPHVPSRSDNFFQEYSWADLLVHHEGEAAFTEILKAKLQDEQKPCAVKGCAYLSIPGLSVNAGDGICKKTEDRKRAVDLDALPSPYLTGIFDDFPFDQYEFQASSETHRGCGYSCQFCQWGDAVFTKVRKFGDKRVVDEYKWMADKKINLVYNCDANFAMYERDIEITKSLIELKRKFGFPKKFRAAYAKNAVERVYQVSKLLNDAGMSKGATLSFQSMDPITLETVKRKNIGVDAFKGLMKRYRQENIPTYSEIIIGLPGETYNSFANGLNQLLECHQHDSVNCYCCEILPNAEMAAPEYLEKHGIKSIEVPVLFFHGTPSEDELYQEKYHLVISTNTLPRSDWLRCMRLSWAIQAFHCLPLLQIVAVFCKAHEGISYRNFYERLLEWAEAHPGTLIGSVAAEATDLFVGITQGKGWGIVDSRFGEIIWPPEEGSFLKCVAEKDRFYDEFWEFLETLIDGEVKVDVFYYQILSLIDPFRTIGKHTTVFQFKHDIRSYLEAAYLGEPAELKEQWITYEIEVSHNYERDLEKYAREAVWYGRKGGTLLHKVKELEGVLS